MYYLYREKLKMSSIFVRKEIVVELKINVECALWLKGLVQNSLIEDETYEENRHRENIFNLLHDANLEKYNV